MSKYRKVRKIVYAKDIEDIIKQFFEGKYEISLKELLKLNRNTLFKLYHILNELKQKRLEDYV